MSAATSERWSTTVLDSVAQLETTLLDLTARRWLCRGQSMAEYSLSPSMDRGSLAGIPRLTKLELERRSITLFRSAVKSFAGSGEKNAVTSDLVALMVMRHYGVPTRLLDWSLSPYVAAYFAAANDSERDGAIWAFEHDGYARIGAGQWDRWPETKSNTGQFVAELTAFNTGQPPDWFVCQFYEADMPRQQAQRALYSLTARFDRDHADSIADLLVDGVLFHRYIIPAERKLDALEFLLEHGVSRARLFPDSAGAADTVCLQLFPKTGVPPHET